MPEKTFIQHFRETVTDVKVKDKHSSWLMKAVAAILAFLTKLKIVDFPKEKFMNDFTTTIGRTIYSGRMTEESDPNTLVVHELTHVVQWDTGGIGFALSYLFSSKKRAYYESEAHQAGFLLVPDKMSDDRLQRKATVLVSYGCDYNYSLELLKDRRTEVYEERPKPRPMSVQRAVEEWKGV